MAGDLRIGDAEGPYDIDDLATPPEDLANSHLDLGSVLVPVVEGGQVTVEMSPRHTPEAVYLVTPVGRVSVHAFAAPRSGGLWREVVRELAESLRKDGADTQVQDGHWGREVVARVPGGEHRFIGVDGPRWMVRAVASGPDRDAEQLAQLARAVLSESVVRRGGDPMPPREVLPLVLPPVLAEQVAAAQAQLAQQQEAAAAAAAGSSPAPAGAQEQLKQATVVNEPVRDSSGEPVEVPAPEDDAPSTASGGSAMQRLRQRKRT